MFDELTKALLSARDDVRAWARPARDWMQDADSQIMGGIRHYLGPHAGPPVQAALKYGPEMLGPGADVRDMTEGSSQLAQALMNRDYSGALEGGALMAGGAAAAVLPAVSTAMFLGPTAKNANIGAMKRAQEMKAAGKTDREIWDETGWFEAADGRWKFEADDSEAFLEHPAGAPKGAEMLRHEVLEDEYDLSGIQYAINDGDIARGSYNPDFDTVMVRGPTANDRRSVALHELMHGVQHREGFARGGNPESMASEMLDDVNARMSSISARMAAREKELGLGGYRPKTEDIELNALRKEYDDLMDSRTNAKDFGRDGYRRLAGEVEARNVQTRRNWGMDERRATPPWETEDVPRDRQIVRFRSPLSEALRR